MTEELDPLREGIRFVVGSIESEFEYHDVDQLISEGYTRFFEFVTHGFSCIMVAKPGVQLVDDDFGYGREFITAQEAMDWVEGNKQELAQMYSDFDWPKNYVPQDADRYTWRKEEAP